MKWGTGLLRALLVLAVVLAANPWQALAETAATTTTTTTATQATPATTTTPATTVGTTPPVDAAGLPVYSESLKALVILFVLAILIESALAVIFNWRLFLQLFYGRGVKTLAMIAVSALVVWAFHVNVLETLMGAYGLTPTGPSHSSVAFWLTALILAGGSAGVYRILVGLGYRQQKTPEEVTPRPARNMAWIAIRTIRRDAVGPITVAVDDLGPRPANSPPPLAGMIVTEGFWRRLAYIFLLDRTRWPQAGGHNVIPGNVYSIQVSALNATGQTINAGINGVYSFTDGAIIDFTTTI